MEETNDKLRRNNICYKYKEPWVLGNKCVGKGKVHYISVMSDNEEEEE